VSGSCCANSTNFPSTALTPKFRSGRRQRRARREWCRWRARLLPLAVGPERNLVHTPAQTASLVHGLAGGASTGAAACLAFRVGARERVHRIRNRVTHNVRQALAPAALAFTGYNRRWTPHSARRGLGFVCRAAARLRLGSFPVTVLCWAISRGRARLRIPAGVSSSATAARSRPCLVKRDGNDGDVIYAHLKLARGGAGGGRSRKRVS